MSTTLKHSLVELSDDPVNRASGLYVARKHQTPTAFGCTAGVLVACAVAVLGMATSATGLPTAVPLFAGQNGLLLASSATSVGLQMVNVTVPVGGMLPPSVFVTTAWSNTFEPLITVV